MCFGFGGHLTVAEEVYRLADGHMEELFSGSYENYGEADGGASASAFICMKDLIFRFYDDIIGNVV